MSEETLLVPTAFTDIHQLAEGLVGRVEPERIMLYGPAQYEPGTPVAFSLTLLDGTRALEGRGRAVQTVDGGEERDPQTRFDVIFDSLEFFGSGSVVFERILLIQQNPGADTGEVSVEETVELGGGEAEAVDQLIGGAEDDPAPAEHEVALSEPAEELEVAFDAPDEGLVEVVAADDALESFQDEAEAAAPPPIEVGSSAGPATALGVRSGALLRPSLAATWEPRAEDLSAGQVQSGYFQFTGGLPTPAEAPRPDLDPSFMVQAAPRHRAGDEEVPEVVAAPPTVPEEVPAPEFDEPMPIEEGPTEAYDLTNLPKGVSPTALGLEEEGEVSADEAGPDPIEVELQDVGDDASFEDVARELEDGP